MYYLVLKNTKPIGLYTSVVDAIKITRTMDKYVIYKMVCNTEENEVYKVVNPIKKQPFIILNNIKDD